MDDFRVRRTVEQAQRDDAARPGDPPDVEAAALLAVIPGAGAPADNALVMRSAGVVGSAGTGFSALVLGAPPTTATPGSLLPATRICRKVGGRWVAQNGFCKCGPVHPQRTVTLSATFPQATRIGTPDAFGIYATASYSVARATASVAMTWGQEAPTDDHIAGTGTVTPYGWQADRFGDYRLAGGGPFWARTTDGLGVVTTTGYAIGYGGVLDGDSYLRHRFTLRCRAGGYDLLHEMRTVYSYRIGSSQPLDGVGGSGIGGSLTFGIGYRATYRGVVRHGSPLSIEFLDGPASWESIDASFDGTSWTTRYTGLARLPRFNGVPSGNADTEVRSSGPAIALGSAGLFAAPFGGWTFTIA